MTDTTKTHKMLNNALPVLKVVPNVLIKLVVRNVYKIFISKNQESVSNALKNALIVQTPQLAYHVHPPQEK